MMLFNVFMNDLFFQIKSVKLNAYADDEQLYDSDIDPAELEKRLLRELNTANTWYNNNGMIVNPEKHKAMVLGTTNYTFSFPVKNSMELFGMTIDTEMNFKEHLATICNKINSQAPSTRRRLLTQTLANANFFMRLGLPSRRRRWKRSP